MIQIQSSQYFKKKKPRHTEGYTAEPKTHKDTLQCNAPSGAKAPLSTLQCSDIEFHKNEKKKRMQRKHLRALYRQRGWEPTPIITDGYVRQYSGFKPERTF